MKRKNDTYKEDWFSFWVERTYTALVSSFRSDLIPFKDINKLFAIQFKLRRKQTRFVLKILEKEGLISIQGSRGIRILNKSDLVANRITGKHA